LFAVVAVAVVVVVAVVVFIIMAVWLEVGITIIRKVTENSELWALPSGDR
jgi:hypothetical protein